MAEAAPAAVTHGLRWQIAEPRFDAAPHAPGSTEFRFWNAEAALTRCAGFWAPPMPQGTRWSTLAPVLPVTLVAGQWLNARYRRLDGLQFFQDSVNGVDVFSAESPDVVCHEMGHAVLDAAGGRVETSTCAPLRYGKPGFANPHFIAYGAMPREAPVR